jgi:hypothetical protein
MHNKTTTITTKNGQLARPLKVLVPLIRGDIENAEHAGKMFRISAGGKLIEAKEQIEPTKWTEWLMTNFHLSVVTAQAWMQWYRAEHPETQDRQEVRKFDSYNDFRRSTQPGWRKQVRQPVYHERVEKVLSGVNAMEMRERAASAAKEHELERKLANQLIKIGYGVLATKFHPDKGGSVDAMRRLNKVTKALREVYS